ncbi:MAG TPA: asparagine synthase-related protein, partial [Gemmatimonadales bacterium]
DARRLYAGPLAALRATGRAPGAERLSREYERVRGSELRRMRWTDIATYLADELLPKVDVATMAHGLEARAPLLDQEVVRFALSLPDGWLVGPDGGKLILRRLLARHVPRELFERPKQGFSIPLSRWLTGAASTRLDQLASSERLLGTGWFRRDGLRAMAAEHRSGQRDHGERLFTLLVLDEWLRQQ